VSDAGEKSAVDVDTSSLLSQNTTLSSQIKPDADQAIIDATALDAGAGKLSDSLKAPKKGDGGNNGLDGFTNLDDLVNYQGPITGDFKTMLRTDLLFDFGSAELRSSARISLQKLGMIILTNDKAKFKLVGHTDTIGDEASNNKLSLARAQAVKDWLVNSLRMTGDNITCEGAGEREPLPGVDVKGSAEAQQLNRRVEIHKTGGG
jgi:outer membrane protein OmpA-like peptidoglycan-associated protein